MRPCLHWIVISLATIVGASITSDSAAAATISVSTTPFISFDHLDGATSAGSGEIPSGALFDESLGSLESVEILFNGEAGVSKSLDVTPGSYWVFASLRVELGHAGTGLQFQAVTAPLGLSGRTVTESGPHDFWEANVRIFRLVATDHLDIFKTGGILEARSTGLIKVGRAEDNQVVYDGLGDSLGGYTTIGQTITYTYTPIPEPSTAVLVALGLAGLVTRGSRTVLGPRSAGASNRRGD